MASLQDEFQSENDGAPNGKLPAGIYAMRIWNEAERFGWIGKGKKVHIGNMIYIYIHGYSGTVSCQFFLWGGTW